MIRGDPRDVPINETWHITTLEQTPNLPGFLQTRSIFYSDASEIESKPMLKALTYGYEHATSRYIIGAQILSASGWTPDCTEPDGIIFYPPPSQHRSHFLPNNYRAQERNQERS